MQLSPVPVSTVAPIDESSSPLGELEIIAAGNQGFLAIGNWLKSYEKELIELFNPPKG